MRMSPRAGGAVSPIVNRHSDTDEQASVTLKFARSHRMSSEQTLTLIRIAHTAIWAVMATAIAALPIVAVRGRFRTAAWLTALIVAECVVLAFNGGRCPLTDLAAQFTADR